MQLVKLTHIVPVTNEGNLIEVEETVILNTDKIVRIECDAKHWKAGSTLQTKYKVVAEMGKQNWDAYNKVMNMNWAVYEYFTNELPKPIEL